MKKKLSFITIPVLALALSACGNSAPATTTTAANEQPAATTTAGQESSTEQTTTAETTVAETTTAKNTDNKAGFKQTATISETVLVDQDGIKVTATELTYSKYAASLELTLENSTDSDYEIMSGTLGYSCNSVNGIMTGGYFNCDVKAGKKAKESISFKYEELLLYGIDEIADIEIGIYSEDSDRNYTYYPVSQIKTTAAGSFDYGKINCYNALTSSDMQSSNSYTVTYSAQDKLYDVDDVSIVSEILFENRDGDPMLLIEAVNNSAYQSRISVNDIVINGITVSSGRWTSELINPGKTALIDINLASAFDKMYWEMYGITEIRNIRLGIGQSDFEGTDESKPETIEIPVIPGGGAADTSGIIAYDEGGVRVIYKDIAGGRYDYDDSLYVMLLIENKSGETKIIDDSYDSFSLNGFMADSYIYSTTVGNDECAVWKIEIPERGLEDAGVKEASDIEEIEFTLEIRDQNWGNKKDGSVKIELK